MGLAIEFSGVDNSTQIESALATLQAGGADAFLVMHQPFTSEQRERIVGLVARLRVPAIYGSREAVEQGGLISYAVDVSAPFRRAAFFVDRILRGARPAELPVEQPTAFELAVNLRTARALEISSPQAVLVRADRVVE